MATVARLAPKRIIFYPRWPDYISKRGCLQTSIGVSWRCIGSSVASSAILSLLARSHSCFQFDVYRSIDLHILKRTLADVPKNRVNNSANSWEPHGAVFSRSNNDSVFSRSPSSPPPLQPQFTSPTSFVRLRCSSQSKNADISFEARRKEIETQRPRGSSWPAELDQKMRRHIVMETRLVLFKQQEQATDAECTASGKSGSELRLEWRSGRANDLSETWGGPRGRFGFI